MRGAAEEGATWSATQPRVCRERGRRTLYRAARRDNGLREGPGGSRRNFPAMSKHRLPCALRPLFTILPALHRVFTHTVLSLFASFVASNLNLRPSRISRDNAAGPGIGVTRAGAPKDEKPDYLHRYLLNILYNMYSK